MIYCHVLENIVGFNPQLPDLSFPERWFTVDPKNLIMTNYIGEEAFHRGIGDSIYWLLNDPDTLFMDFKKNVWSIPWIPDTVKWEHDTIKVAEPCWLIMLVQKVGGRRK